MKNTEGNIGFLSTGLLHSFSKLSIFSSWKTCTCAYQGVRNVRFSENLARFVFLKHPFWDSLFFVITEEFSVAVYMYLNFRLHLLSQLIYREVTLNTIIIVICFPNNY